jgi:hypothetical protein
VPPQKSAHLERGESRDWGIPCRDKFRYADRKKTKRARRIKVTFCNFLAERMGEMGDWGFLIEDCGLGRHGDLCPNYCCKMRGNDQMGLILEQMFSFGKGWAARKDMAAAATSRGGMGRSMCKWAGIPLRHGECIPMQWLSPR